jgi:hypothetical protein
MPSTEYIQGKTSTNKILPYSRYLRIFILFTCPICQRYTIHKPRINRKGYWYVDHKRVPVHRVSYDGVGEFVGLAPEDACFVDDNNAIMNIETTRTVIRVK